MLDLINSLFEALGLFFIAPSIWQTYKAKAVKGISLFHISYFYVWGFWNLYYYPSLGQSLSFYGGIAITLANTIWLSQIFYYRYFHAGSSN